MGCRHSNIPPVCRHVCRHRRLVERCCKASVGLFDGGDDGRRWENIDGEPKPHPVAPNLHSTRTFNILPSLSLPNAEGSAESGLGFVRLVSSASSVMLCPAQHRLLQVLLRRTYFPQAEASTAFVGSQGNGKVSAAAPLAWHSNEAPVRQYWERSPHDHSQQGNLPG